MLNAVTSLVCTVEDKKSFDHYRFGCLTGIDLVRTSFITSKRYTKATAK